MYLEGGTQRPRRRSGGGASLGSGARAGGSSGRSASGGRASGGGGYAAPVQHYSAPQPRYSGPPTTTSTGHYSGGGAPSAPPSSNRSGPVARTSPPARPAPPSLGKYLGGDSEFQAARSQLIKNFQALRTENKQNRGNLRDDYLTTKSRLATEKQKSAEDMQNDFAARGLLGSGVYADKLAEFEKNYQNQGTDATTSYRRNVNQLLTDLKDAKRLRNSSLRQAKLEAIRRRAEKYGLK